jgi:hypothetical protein
MRTWSKTIPFFLGIWGWILAGAWGATATGSEGTGAIQAIQQAADPSAVVAAFGNGLAASPNDPSLYEAYVNRMVDLGLPELAYHQAQTLTTLEPNRGLAWGVVGYVDARRGDMADAVFAVSLAASLEPENKFVLRTAGEVTAWYDLRADQSTIPQATKDALAKARSLIGNKPAYTEAYNIAKRGYATQSTGPGVPQTTAEMQVQPQPYETTPAAYGEPSAPPMSYIPDNYYDSGPGWIAPAPVWWWAPFGAFAGFGFQPFTGVFLFNDHRFFEHHHFVHDHDGHLVRHDVDRHVAVRSSGINMNRSFVVATPHNVVVRSAPHSGFITTGHSGAAFVGRPAVDVMHGGGGFHGAGTAHGGGGGHGR